MREWRAVISLFLAANLLGCEGQINSRLEPQKSPTEDTQKKPVPAVNEVDVDISQNALVKEFMQNGINVSIDTDLGLYTAGEIDVFLAALASNKVRLLENKENFKNIFLAPFARWTVENKTLRVAAATNSELLKSYLAQLELRIDLQKRLQPVRLEIRADMAETLPRILSVLSQLQAQILKRQDIVSELIVDPNLTEYRFAGHSLSIRDSMDARSLQDLLNLIELHAAVAQALAPIQIVNRTADFEAFDRALRVLDLARAEVLGAQGDLALQQIIVEDGFDRQMDFDSNQHVLRMSSSLRLNEWRGLWSKMRLWQSLQTWLAVPIVLGSDIQSSERITTGLELLRKNRRELFAVRRKLSRLELIATAVANPYEAKTGVLTVGVDTVEGDLRAQLQRMVK